MLAKSPNFEYISGLSLIHILCIRDRHWTWRMKPGFENERPKIGDVFYVVPTHICPTTALYSEVLVAENHVITEHWTVDARR